MAARVLALAAAATILAAAPSPAAPPPQGPGADPRWRQPEISPPVITAPLNAAQREEPPSVASPRANCGPGSRPEPDIQGRVPPGEVSAQGYWCNLQRLGHYGESGGFKTLRYIDEAGHECAIYDSALLFPLNAINLNNPLPTGTFVLDMSDPANPRRTATLLTPAMQSPHESVVINPRRGLLAAVTGNPAFYPGVVDLYDLSNDCRRPALRASFPAALLGHESGFAPDGRTFYAANPGGGPITAVDVTDPSAPRPLGLYQYTSHGMTISDDGNRAYVADARTLGLLILDTSEVQARRPSPQVREVSRLRWANVSIPQNAIPVTIRGHPYVVEVDEYSRNANTTTGATSHGRIVGAARIIDISNEREPFVVGNMRLEVHQPENRDAIAADPGAQQPTQGYAAHYCNVPTRVDPTIVACSMIASGLRVFDIRDPEHPKEIAYHVAPPRQSSSTYDESNFAMSYPEFVPERREIWYTDGATGFWTLRLDEGVWPAADAERPRDCVRARGVTLTVPRRVRGRRVTSARVTVGGRRVRLRRVRGRLRAHVTTNALRRGRGRVVIRVRTSGGRLHTRIRRFTPCP